MRYMKGIVVGVMVYLGAFGIAAFVAWFIKGEEPTALIAALFGGGVIELLITGAMKINELVTRWKTGQKERGDNYGAQNINDITFPKELDDIMGGINNEYEDQLGAETDEP
jgi:hypothetical protein